VILAWDNIVAASISDRRPDAMSDLELASTASKEMCPMGRSSPYLIVMLCQSRPAVVATFSCAFGSLSKLNGASQLVKGCLGVVSDLQPIALLDKY